MTVNSDFGNLLQKLRKRVPLTQKALGKYTGYSEGQISRFESGITPPPHITLQTLFVPALKLTDKPDLAEELLNAAVAARKQAGKTVSRPAVRSAQVSPPAPTTPFFGRPGEIETCLNLLRNPNARLISLIGPPGVGKTRLSIEIAAEADKLFSHPCVWVSIGDFANTAPLAVAIADALTLKHERISAEASLKTVIQELRQKDLVLVIDNLETLIVRGDDSARTLIEILKQAPLVKVLASSQIVLNILGEHVIPISPLHITVDFAQADFATLCDHPAIRLFESRAKMAHPQFETTPHNIAAIARICEKLDGLPLAIELAAARTKLFTPEMILRKFEEEQERPLDMRASTAHGRDLRHRSLGDALGWSYSLLDESQKQLFARLGVFMGGFDASTAQQVCGATLQQIETLADHSLLKIDIQWDAEPRFSMLETVRAYALERLAPSADGEHALRAHAHDIQARLKRDMRYPATSPSAQWRKDHFNVIGALTWLISHEPERALAVATDAFHTYWYPEGYWSDALNWLERAVDANPQAPPERLGIACGLAGIVAHRLGDRQKGERLLRLSQALVEQHGSDLQKFYVVHELGWYYHAAARYDKSIELFQQAHALAQSLENTNCLAMAEFNLASIAIWVDRAYDTARAYYLSAAKKFNSLGNREEWFSAMYCAMEVDLWIGKLEQTAYNLRTLFTSSTDISIGESHFWLLSTLGQCEYHRGDNESSRAYLTQSYNGFKRLGSRYGEAVNGLNLARIHIRANQFDQALYYLADALAIGRKFDSEVLIARCVAASGNLLFAANHTDDAIRLLAFSERIMRAPGSRMVPFDAAEYDMLVNKVQATVDPIRFELLCESGRRLSIDEAQAIALKSLT